MGSPEPMALTKTEFHAGQSESVHHAAPIAASASGRVPPLSGGHGRPEVRPPARRGAPRLPLRLAKPAGAMDGPAGV